MSDLSQFISINAALDNSTGTPVIRITDVSNYPVGVAPTIAGCVESILQPDGISVGNSNFAAPDIYYTGGGLTVASYPLRLNTISQFQTGSYQIQYVVQAPGYSDTVLTQSFNVSYAAPTPVIGNNFDIFTPVLTVSDNTLYSQPNLTLVSVLDTWAVVINSVNGTIKSVGGTGLTFDLNYNGNYYDANYAVTMTAVATWTIPGSAWVTLLGKITLTQSFDSETPPSYNSLLISLDALKAKVDANQSNCNTYPALQASYLNAGVMLYHFQARGCANDLSGLISYVLQLQKIFNNNVTPTPAHTNLPIPAYSFNCAGIGGTSWSSITGKPSTVIIEWTVGQNGYPPAGSNTLTDARLVGFNVLVLRSYTLYLNWSKPLNSGVLTFNDALTPGEVIYVQSIPL